MSQKQNAIGEESDGKSTHKVHLRRKDSGPCLWFLIRWKSSVSRSFSGIFKCIFIVDIHEYFGKLRLEPSCRFFVLFLFDLLKSGN